MIIKNMFYNGLMGKIKLMTNSINEAIADLQSRMSFQDDTITQLSDQIALQDKELTQAKLHIKLLREKFMELSHDMEQVLPSQKNERPPHY